MSRKLLWTCFYVSLLASAGCEAASDVGNSGQPKDLEAPWVKVTDSQISVSSSSSDASGNRIFSCTASEFRGLLEDIAAEYKTSIVVKPRMMLDWRLTIEVKGKSADEILNDVATKCRLSLGKSSGGLPMLALPGDTSGGEATVTPGDDDGGSDDE